MIVVTGEALVDLIVGSDGQLRAVLGGGPFNAARASSRLGHPTAFLGCVSRDVFGRRILTALTKAGVSLELVRSTTKATTLSVAEIEGDGGATYSFYTEGTAGVAFAELTELPSATEALHVGTLGLALEPSGAATELLVAAADPGVLVFLDPNCRPGAIDDRPAYVRRIERVAGRADVIKVSTDDLEYLYPGPAERGLARLLELGPSVVFVTDGARGARVATVGGMDHVPTAPAHVVDTVGAGDAFGAGFLVWWLARGLDRAGLAEHDLLLPAAAFACEVARRTCERAGATTPTVTEMAAWMEENGA